MHQYFDNTFNFLLNKKLILYKHIYFFKLYNRKTKILKN
jgi:hypothetical protein